MSKLVFMDNADSIPFQEHTFKNKRNLIWFLCLPFFFLIYTFSFSSFGIIEKKHSVLGDADAANYIFLIKDFSLTREYGDPYSQEGRSIGDNAQKHKLHHILYAFLAGCIYKIIYPLYSGLGLSNLPEPVYMVNALLTCFNLVFLYFLLKRFNIFGNPIFPFLIFYGVSLSTWIYASIPESWPFSATLMLIFLLALYEGSFPDWVLSSFIGISMLNNLILGFLLIFLLMEFWSKGRKLKEFFIFGFSMAGVVASSWIISLFFLSFFDPSFRPDKFIVYTFWFKEFTQPDLNIFSFYVWKSVVSNLFITSVVSNQSDPSVPQEALLYTLRTSKLGLISTLAYLLLMGGVVLGIYQKNKDSFSFGFKWLRVVLRDRGIQIVVGCMAMVFITIFLHYPGAFLYSTITVPLLVLLLGRFINLRNSFHKFYFFCVLFIVLINNSMQIFVFRDMLGKIV